MTEELKTRERAETKFKKDFLTACEILGLEKIKELVKDMTWLVKKTRPQVMEEK